MVTSVGLASLDRCKRRSALAGPSARARWLVLFGAAATLCSACSVLPPRPPAPESHALDGSGTLLARVGQASLVSGAESGFQLLPVASGAYEARLALAEQAERSIDLQTFVLSADDTGRYLLSRLSRAARRGVRVRVLVDDLNTAGSDDFLRSFANEANVEVRLFNPFVLARWSTPARLAASLNELGRVNHRMHNKLYVADNAIAVFGGRNTGDEYFMRGAADNFVDLDVLGAGAVVRDLSLTFDAYWNSAYAYPIDSVVATVSRDRLGRLRDELHQARPPPLDESVPQRLQGYVSVPAELAEARLNLVGARAGVQADPTDKASGTRMRDRNGTVRAFVADAIRSAQREVLIVSPYFIPGELGMEAMRHLRASGVSLTLLTNSLASTDEPSVHGGYRRYRRELLAAGVEIYELSPTLARQAKSLGRFGDSMGRLHAKVTVIDRSRLFIGSMNLDTRSERYNTELGVLIESPALAEEFLDLARFKGSAYRLRLDERGELEWVAGEGVEQRVLTSEPETGWWLRLKARLLSDIVPEGWL